MAVAPHPLASDGDVQRRESIQRHDRIVRSAMHDVSVPPASPHCSTNLPLDDQTNILSAAPASGGETVSLPARPAAPGTFGQHNWFTAVLERQMVIALTIGLWPKRPPGPVEASEEKPSAIERHLGERC